MSVFQNSIAENGPDSKDNSESLGLENTCGITDGEDNKRESSCDMDCEKAISKVQIKKPLISASTSQNTKNNDFSLSFGFSSMGVDINIPLYNSNSGYFGSPNFGVSTTLFGAGLQWSFNNPVNKPRSSNDLKEDIPISVGIGPSKYNFAGSFNQDFSRLGLAYGIGVGLPGINFGTSMHNFISKISKKIETTMTGIDSVIPRADKE